MKKHDGLVEQHPDSHWGYTVQTVNGIPLTFTRIPDLTINDPNRRKKAGRKPKDEVEEPE